MLRCQTIDLYYNKTVKKSNFDSDIVRRSYAHRKMDTTIQVLTNGFHFIKLLHISKFISKGIYTQLRPSNTIRCKDYNFKTQCVASYVSLKCDLKFTNMKDVETPVAKDKECCFVVRK